MGLFSVISHASRLLSVVAGARARLLLCRLARCAVGVLDGARKWPQTVFLIKLKRAKQANAVVESIKPVCVAAGLTASLEHVDEGDSSDEEGEEHSEGDEDEELEEVLLWGAGGRTTTTSWSSSSSGTLLLHWSSCWVSNSATLFPTGTGKAQIAT